MSGFDQNAPAWTEGAGNLFDQEAAEQARVESTLTKLTPVFRHLRKELSSNGSFLNIEDNDLLDEETAVGLALTIFRDAILEGDKLAVRNLKLMELKDQNLLCRFLEEGCFERKVLLAYYGLNEESPWARGERSLSDKQSYQSKGFPNDRDIVFVMIAYH